MHISTVTDIITKQVLNDSTGELEPTTFRKEIVRKRIRGGFRMVYKSYDEAILLSIKSQKDLEILIYIRDLFTYTQVENALIATEIGIKHGVSRQKITTLLKVLITNGLIKKVSKVNYRLNPFMYLPFRADAETLQAEWNLLDA